MLPTLLLAGASMLPIQPAQSVQSVQPVQSGHAALRAAGPDGDVFAFQDPRIWESSGLVDLGSVMVTTNDSGDSARLFVVSPRSGETIALTTYGSQDPVDVEALAPAGPGEVWVGDIGDNTRSRKDVEVYRVPVAARQISVDRPKHYRLIYPDGAHDAESLVADRVGRLYVITKSLAGGTVYRAPATLHRSGSNRLERVATVGDYATDAALLRGGRFVVVRGLGQASVYTFPAFDRIGTFALPRQRQGEGISIGPGGRIRISSEGVRSAVKEVGLPDSIAAAMRQPSPATTTPLAPEAVGAGRREDESVNTWLGWVVGGALVLAAVGATMGVRSRSR